MTASPASLSDTVVVLHFPTIGLSQRLNVSNYTFLGRPNNQETRPMVDLTIFLGHLLGVSREHAALILTDEGLHIQDLGSTNGSWLNQRRLAPRSPVPLQNGDHLRLGRLDVEVYLPDAQSEIGPDLSGVPAIQNFGLKEPSGQPLFVTPSYLVGVISPYLAALSAAQSVVNELEGCPRRLVALDKIYYPQNGSSSVIEVSFIGIDDILRFSREHLLAWRDKNREDLIQATKDSLRGIDGTTTVSVAENAGVASLEQVLAESGIQGGLPVLRQSLSEIELAFASRLLSRYGKTRLQPERHLHHLTPYIHTLLISRLELLR